MSNIFTVALGLNSMFSTAPSIFGLAPTGNIQPSSGAAVTYRIMLENGPGDILLETGAGYIELEVGP